MAGCNCKGKKQIINNLNSPDHIQYAKDVYNRVIAPNTTQEFSNVDRVEIIGAYSTLYPASSNVPSM